MWKICFRLTIRNVNVIKIRKALTFPNSFRLTIRNVNPLDTSQVDSEMKF